MAWTIPRKWCVSFSLTKAFCRPMCTSSNQLHSPTLSIELCYTMCLDPSPMQLPPCNHGHGHGTSNRVFPSFGRFIWVKPCEKNESVSTIILARLPQRETPVDFVQGNAGSSAASLPLGTGMAFCEGQWPVKSICLDSSQNLSVLSYFGEVLICKKKWANEPITSNNRR